MPRWHFLWIWGIACWDWSEFIVSVFVSINNEQRRAGNETKTASLVRNIGKTINRAAIVRSTLRTVLRYKFSLSRSATLLVRTFHCMELFNFLNTPGTDSSLLLFLFPHCTKLSRRWKSIGLRSRGPANGKYVSVLYQASAGVSAEAYTWIHFDFPSNSSDQIQRNAERFSANGGSSETHYLSRGEGRARSYEMQTVSSRQCLVPTFSRCNSLSKRSCALLRRSTLRGPLSLPRRTLRRSPLIIRFLLLRRFSSFFTTSLRSRLAARIRNIHGIPE